MQTGVLQIHCHRLCHFGPLSCQELKLHLGDVIDQLLLIHTLVAAAKPSVNAAVARLLSR